VGYDRVGSSVEEEGSRRQRTFIGQRENIAHIEPLRESGVD